MTGEFASEEEHMAFVRRVVGEYRWEEVENVRELWEVLKDLEPVDTDCSFHVESEDYEHDGQLYQAGWTIGGGGGVPDWIMKRVKIDWPGPKFRQLELFS